MEILFLSYCDFSFNGRTIELVKVAEQLGNLHCFYKDSQKKGNSLFKRSGYFNFIRDSIKYAKKHKNEIDALFIDNRLAAVPALRIIKTLKPKVSILDCRELYFFKDVKSIKAKIGCIFEKKMINKVDYVIAANKERAQYMDLYYKLRNSCLVYENLRKLQYSSDVDLNALKDKYSDILSYNRPIVISSAGCLVERGTDRLVENYHKVEKDTSLLLVGGSPKKDEEIIKQIIDKYELKNVYIVGQVSHNELKFLINQSQIGIVNYSKVDFNNLYCASGKLYEYIYEGIPVVTTENPPLKSLCDQFSIGVADDEYYHGINLVLKNHDYYKEHAIELGKKYTVEENNRQLVTKLKQAVSLIDK